MIASMIIALSAPLVWADVSEFFPLNPGDQWIYMEETGRGKYRVTDIVGDMVDIEGIDCYPVITKRGKREIERVYYHMGEGEVVVVAFKRLEPLSSTYPIVRLPEMGKEWEYVGETFVAGDLADLTMKGKVKFSGRKEFDGEKIDTIEVRLEATILAAFGTPTEVVQVATYGRGVGLLSMDMTTKHPKTTEKSKRQLIRYTPKNP